MAVQLQGVNNVPVQGDSFLGSLRVDPCPRGPSYAISTVTGLIGAAAAANGCFFAFRNGLANPKNIHISQFRIQYTVTTAFTTPVTAGRRLSLYRGSGAAASSGTALTSQAQLNPFSEMSGVAPILGGDVRVSSTASLTVTGITFETQEIESFQLTGFGAASALAVFDRRYDAAGSKRIELRPGELIALRNPVAMDAAGVWQVAIDLEWFEV